jgi:hypothetical protein
MIIRTSKKTENFTILDNHCLKDKQLSWAAKGLIAYLLHLPDEWDVTLAFLQNISSNGRRATNTAIRELESAGYLQREEKKNSGKFAGYDYTVVESPRHVSCSAFRAAQNVTQVSTNIVSTNTVECESTPKKEKKVREEHCELARFLKEIVLLRRERQISSKVVNGWANSIRLMEMNDGWLIEDIKVALLWYKDNWQGDYIPVIESGATLRKKFSALLGAIDRSTGVAVVQDCGICDYKVRGYCKEEKPNCTSFVKK